MAASTTPRKAQRKDAGASEGDRGVHVALFFAFVFLYFAIFSLMTCAVSATLGGVVLLFVSLTVLVSAYLSLAQG
jgi:hypothetical protein